MCCDLWCELILAFMLVTFGMCLVYAVIFVMVVVLEHKVTTDIFISQDVRGNERQFTKMD